jgi:hypothetical protein
MLFSLGYFMRINGIQPDAPLERPEFLKKVAHENQVPTLKETLAIFLKDINETKNTADDGHSENKGENTWLSNYSRA